MRWLPNEMGFSIPRLLFVLMGTWFYGKGRWKEVGRMQAVIDNSVYIDSGLLSGLEAMSELRELLDELYGNLG